jgi:hypothetical protein
VTGKLLRFAILPSVLALWSAHAHAAPGDATRLEYARSEAAKGCPDRDALRSAVTQRLGYDPFFPVARQTIVVEITDVSDGLRARMNLVDDQGLIVGSRELRERTEHCDELVASLALAISIALDPSAALGGGAAADSGAPDADAQPPEPETTPEVAAPPQRPTRPHSPPALSLSQASTAQLTVRGGAFVASGVAPALAWGLRGGVGARWHWFQLVAEFADQFPVQHAVAGGSVRASLYEGSLAPCVAKSWLAACALLNVGVQHSEGRDIPYSAAHKSLYAALGARVEAAPQLVGHLRLLLSADALKSLTPVTLRLHGEQVWKTPFVSVVLGAGLALQFP